ncbi:MAG: DUF2807 domain-containing protein [Bacteroidales bacterium]|nr:DUF2807 domain-containing protein [Bacteroidales bacterium]
MKKILACLMLVCGMVAVHADEIPGNQDVKTDYRDVAEFQQVVVNADFNVVIKYSVSPKVEVTAESNLLSHIVTEVKGKTLNVNVEKKTKLVPNFPIVVTLSMPLINKFQYKGDGSIQTDAIPSDKMELILDGKGSLKMNNLKTNSLKLTATGFFHIEMADVVSGGSKISLSDNVSGMYSNFSSSKLEIEYKTLESSTWKGIQSDALTINGESAGSMEFSGFAGKNVSATMTSTGRVVMSGTASSVNVTASNAGSFEAIMLSAEKCKVVNNGTGDLSVNATSSLDVTIASSGNVSFKGDLKISYTNTGTGQLVKKK